jgi:hypothetical protein
MCLTTLVSSGFACDASPAPNTLKQIGISETMLSAVIGDEYQNAQQLVNEKIAFCESQIYQEAAGYMSRGAYNASLIDSRTVGERKTGTKPAYTGTGGFIIDLDVCSNNVPDLAINISNISLHVQFTGNITLKAWNITENKEIFSQVVAVTSGVLTNVPVNIQAKNGRKPSKIAIGYTKTGIVSEAYTMYADCQTCPIKQCGMYVHGYGADFDTSTWAITRNGHMSGMSIDYSLSCLYEKVVCANQHLMALPMLYKVGAELMMYALNTYRYNDTEKEKFQNYLNHFASNYSTKMEFAFSNLRLPNNECFGCVPKFGTKTITP